MENNLKLVPFVIHKYFERVWRTLTPEDREDLIAIGNVGLVKAAQRYDKNKQKFSSYACVCIRANISHHFRTQNAKKRKGTIVSMQNLLQTAEGIAYEDVLADKRYNTEEDYTNKETLKFLISHLNNREKLIIRYYFFENLTQRQIGSIIGASQTTVSRVIEKALAKMKRLYELV